ncbi:hypothetical protein ACFSTC_05055 [Nonomuraea ferruginea]
MTGSLRAGFVSSSAAAGFSAVAGRDSRSSFFSSSLPPLSEFFTRSTSMSV